MIEHQPGMCGDIEPASDTMKKLMDMMANDNLPHAVHFGTINDLENKRIELSEPSAKKSDIDFLQQQISTLKNDVDNVKDQRVVRGLTIPNREEIEKFGVK